MLRALAIALVLLLGVPGHAATRLEASRAAATVARGQVREVRSRQTALRRELSEVASRIEALKAERKGKLTPGPALDQALRRSQELSNQLTSLAQALFAAESSAEREHLALLAALSEELTAVRASLERQSDPAARKPLIDRMRALRAERDQVRAALPAAAVPALESGATSDDPEDLLEQADALKDREDKVRDQLRAIDARIRERREERELDRRMNQFIGDESLFDDHDRRFRLRKDSTRLDRGGTESSAADSAGGEPNGAAREAAAGGGDTSPPPMSGSPTPSSGIGGTGDTDPGSRGTGAPTEPPSLVNRSARASDPRPSVEGGRGIAGSGEDELDDLEVQRQKLRNLAEELKARASELEQKARKLQ